MVNGGTIFYSAAEYKFRFEGALESLTPKVSFRGVRGYDNIVDVGVNAVFLDNLLNIMALYHTSKSLTAGFGVNISNTVTIQALYHAQTGGYNNPNNGAYEIGASVHLFR
ncbi:type IX secretion system membrane protein PorP/SprF [Chitinophaga oryzae]|nr:type IX secretion system membrane protein PorP/SprF [Chitinophaga oryzae]